MSDPTGTAGRVPAHIRGGKGDDTITAGGGDSTFHIPSRPASGNAMVVAFSLP